jgi:CRISPR/Cas system CSM-associated protein Csm3 (group 7 of RAMP superfamily)
MTVPRRFVLLRLDLELLTPGGVSAPEALADREVRARGVDLPLARDGWNRLYVPATSLAGSLRACAEATGRDPSVLFGAVRQSHDPDPETGRPVTEATASPIRFLGTAISDVQPDRRTRNTIDRVRGATVPTRLWRGELLPAGTSITCYLRLDDPGLLDALIGVLAAWRPHIGGGQSVGRGQARLVGVCSRTIDLATIEGLRAWLTGGGPSLFDDASTEPVNVPDTGHQQRRHQWRWEIVDGLHVGSGSRAESLGERTSAPALVLRSGGRPCIPGSTWKGLLRSRCEYILRSVGGRACHSADADRACRREPVCDVCAIFGWTGRDDEAAETAGQRSRLLFADSVIEDDHIVVRQHVALDRVTGGARPNQLYAQEIVESGTCTLDITIADENDLPPIALPLLDLAIADIDEGYLAVGAATTRGHGTLRRTDVNDDDRQRERQAATAELSAYLNAAESEVIA